VETDSRIKGYDVTQRKSFKRKTTEQPFCYRLVEIILARAFG